MATKKIDASKATGRSKPVPKPTPKPAPTPRAASRPGPAKSRLENLAAKPHSFDDTIDEQLVDHSGVFRVTNAISQAQVGHGDDARRFAADSMRMAAQREDFADEPTTVDEERRIDDDVATVAKRQRRATLEALAAMRRPNRR